VNTINTLGFIGFGNMGKAIYNGLDIYNGLTNSTNLRDMQIHIYDPLSDSSTLGGEVEIAEKCKYILLGVKPQSVEEVLEKISPVLTKDSVIISICAGISIEYVYSVLSRGTGTAADIAVVQVMPNTPMMLGLGASAIAFSENCSGQEQEFVRLVINSCGISEIIPADKMNEIICINGSSPAFIYLFAKCFTDYAAEQGIDEKSALNLFSQTLTGAAKMLTDSGKSADELIKQVSSKGGTTVAGLEQLRAGGFTEAVKSACEACTNRAYELGNSRNIK